MKETKNFIVNVDGIKFSNSLKLKYICGPCVIESEESYYKTILELKKIFKKIGSEFIAKASFDKANRSSIDSFRGVGLKEGIKILNRVKNELNVKILVDIHLPSQADEVATVADIIQIPAFLSRQTDIIIAAGRTRKAVNVKKGQFLSPWDVENIIKKIESTGNNKIMITERGTTFGYNNLVVDMRALDVIKRYGYPVIFDSTHSIQRPGGLGNKSGGDREFVLPLSKSAVIQKISAVFFETHPNPEKALSDGPNSLPLKSVEKYVKILNRIDELAKKLEDNL
jgi:2-dehydro-3-deoxyphosphooctonate aldolase (KDO 8-P synthase)